MNRRKMMRTDCFAYELKEQRDGTTKERCFCTERKKCNKCPFYKHKDTVAKHTFYIYQTQIVEWIPK